MSITLFLVVDIYSVRLNTRFACSDKLSQPVSAVAEWLTHLSRAIRSVDLAGPRAPRQANGIIIVGGNRKRRRECQSGSRAKISAAQKKRGGRNRESPQSKMFMRRWLPHRGRSRWLVLRNNRRHV